MSHRTGTKRPTWQERALCLLLAAVLLAGLVPGTVLPASAEHWADPYLDTLVDWGAIRADQTSDPDAALTRAEFMGIVNRAYGYSEKGEIPFTDVVTTDWFYDDVCIAYTAGYMAGTSETTASPNDFLTREQAVCILGRNMMMKDTPGESLAFADSRDVSDWARGTIKTAVDNYIISGFDDNTFHPQAAISKGQMAALITQCIGTPVRDSGTYELGGVFGNVTITAPNTTLRNTTVSGDLYISGGVGLGGIKLENVNVLGRIIVSGTGESEGGAASVIMRNVAAEEMLVDNMRNKTVTIRADGITDIANTVVRTNAYLEDNNTDEKGLMHIELDGESGTRLTLAGRIKEVVDKTPNSYVQTAKGTVAKLTVDEHAVNSTVQLDRNTVIRELNLDVAANVTGDGDIEKLNVNAPGSTVSMLPEDTYIRPGLTGNIAGVIMDHTAAEEGSLDPMLLSGYPAAKDITPTGLRADFAGNKVGTIYWAVSNITDGSVTEDDLIAPPSYGSIAVSNGSLACPEGGREVSAQITGLTVGGSYYLSAVLVDGQGVHSPVKVISFSTPDNTVPAFGQGYPYMSFIGKESDYDAFITAQVTVMPTKDCRMYYAVLPKGAVAPTVNELRAAAVSANVGYGVVDLTKNLEEPFIVSRRLEERKDYVLYMWLTDGNNGSQVLNLPFSTPDVTPPVFTVAPYVNGQPQATSVPMSAAINENGTIFWAVVEAGEAYPKPNNQNAEDNEENNGVFTARLDSDYAKLQVANGMNALRSGKVTATADTEVAMNITGLSAEKAYDLYYLAQDSAGNYSISVYKLPGGIHTLDTSGPIISQHFSEPSGQENSPMADTDITLRFSEQVSYNAKNLMDLYNNDRTEFVNYLHMAVKLFQQSIGVGRPQEVFTELDVAGGLADDWVVDYTQARMQRSTEVDGAVELVFPNAGLKLSSGSTYYFTITGITDDSDKNNPTDPPTVDYNQRSVAAGHSVPRFTVASAQVTLIPSTLDSSDYPYKTPAEGAEREDEFIDFSFYMSPKATANADPGFLYDLMFWSETRMSFDVFCRVVDSRTRQPVTDFDGSLVPDTNPGAEERENGWFRLGNSGTLMPTTGETLAGVDLHKQFNHCNAATFPRLNSLDDSGSYYYEYGVKITRIGTVSDRAAWSDDVTLYVNVAAGTGGPLENLANRATRNYWENTFLAQGLTGGGGASIGISSVDGSDTLKLDTSFSNTRVPSFLGSAPVFRPTDSSVEIRINLDLAGTVYWLVAPVEPVDVTSGIESIRTTATLNGQTLSDRALYNSNNVPTSGGSDDPNITTPGWVSAPEIEDVMNPPYPAGQIKKGTFTYTGGQGLIPITPMPSGLLPNQEYFCYMVLRGESRETSKVYLYTFKTDATSKPKIALSDNENGTVRITTTQDTTSSQAVEADLVWRVFTDTDGANRLTGLGSIAVPLTDSNGNAIKGYHTMTALEALKTRYNATTAYGSPVPSNAQFGSDYNGFSVFDIFATMVQKVQLDEIIRNSDTTTGSINYGDAQTRASGYTTSPDWYTNGNGAQPDPATYLFLVAGHNRFSTAIDDEWATVDSFAALPGVIFRNMDAPKLKEIYGGVTSVKGNYGSSDRKYTGNIIIAFDKDVYWMKAGSSGDPYAVVSNPEDKLDDTNKKVGILYNYSPSNLPIHADSASGSDTFTIRFTDLAEKDIILLQGGRITSKSGNPASGNIVIRIRDERVQQGNLGEMNQLYVEVVFNGRTLATEMFRPNS